MKVGFVLAVICIAGFLPVAQAATPGAVDVLEQTALHTSLAQRSPVIAVAAVPGRIIGVGIRGHILVSDDGGHNIQQIASPVSTDFTAISFSDAHTGWIVGHDGVVLRSRDGGRSWERKLDGNRLNAQVLAYYQNLVKTDSNDEVQAALREAQANVERGPGVGIMDVWFRNEREGFIVGVFNLILHTEDGGETWAPWMHRMENPNGMHLYGVRGDDSGTYIVGEQGLVLRKAPGAERFKALPTPYNGSFFGLALSADRMAVFGLRGNAYVSSDQGASWTALQSEVKSSFVSGFFTPEKRLVLLDQGGGISTALPNSDHLQRATTARGQVTSMANMGSHRVVLGTFSGLSVLAIQ